MSIDWILRNGIAAAPFLGLLISFWAALQSRSTLRRLETISAIIPTLDPGEIREAMEEAREDYLVSFLRRHRWRTSRITRTLTFVIYACVATLSTLFWQLSGYSKDWDFFMVTALVGYVLAFGMYIRDGLVRLFYKDEGR